MKQPSEPRLFQSNRLRWQHPNLAGTPKRRARMRSCSSRGGHPAWSTFPSPALRCGCLAGAVPVLLLVRTPFGGLKQPYVKKALCLNQSVYIRNVSRWFCWAFVFGPSMRRFREHPGTCLNHAIGSIVSPVNGGEENINMQDLEQQSNGIKSFRGDRSSGDLFLPSDRVLSTGCLFRWST